MNTSPYQWLRDVYHFLRLDKLRASLSSEVNRSFLFHRASESDLLREEADMWRSFLFLKRRYGNFLKTLPDYPLIQEKPKIIWWCWLQGENQAPSLCKTCLASVKKNFPDYEIRVVTEENLGRYISIPDYIKQKYQIGIISGAHYSDIIRTMLLVEYGGVWMDSTVLCTGYHIPVFDFPFFVFQNWKFNKQHASICSSWLISSTIGHPILRTTQELLFDYWRNNNQLINYFLFHLFFQMAVERYPVLWEEMPRFSNIPPHMLQFELFRPYDPVRFEQITRMSDFHKLNWKARELQDGAEGSFYAFIQDQG